MMGYLKSIGTVLIYIGFLLAVITFLPGLPPKANYSEYSIKSPSDIQIPIELKNRLQGAEILFHGVVKGPECFTSFNGEIYTGIRGGYVVQIEKDRIKPIVKFGQKCDGFWQEAKCGRPLGLNFNDKGELFVADAYYGIFKVNINSRQYTNIVNSSEPIDGKIPKIVNSLDIAKNGDIYWTTSSTDFYLHDGVYVFLANPTGRLIRYDAATKRNKVLLENIGFANGVLLSDDENFVIVLESLTSRIIKYNLKGPKAGQQEIFAESLPGIPDNVHSDGQGGFLVSMVTVIDSKHPLFFQSLIPHPYIRKMLSRLFYLVEAPFKLLQDIYPNFYSESVLYTVGSFDIPNVIVPKASMIVRMDKTGKVLDALHLKDADVFDISSAYIYNEYLWLGSPWNDYIMRIPLKQAFPDLVTNVKSSVAKNQKQNEPLLTISSTPNIKVDAKVSKPPVKSTIKAQTTQKSNSDATMSKTTTSKSTSTTTLKPSLPSSPPPPPPPSSSSGTKSSTKEVKKDNLKKIEKDNSKEIKKDNSKEIKKDNSKEIKKDYSKEIKKDYSNSQVKTETLRKSNEAIVKPKPDDSTKKDARKTQAAKSKFDNTVKKDARETQSIKSKSDDSVKKVVHETQSIKSKSDDSIKKVVHETQSIKYKFDDSIKKDVYETQSVKSKFVKEEDDSTKK